MSRAFRWPRASPVALTSRRLPSRPSSWPRTSTPASARRRDVPAGSTWATSPVDMHAARGIGLDVALSRQHAFTIQIYLLHTESDARLTDVQRPHNGPERPRDAAGGCAERAGANSVSRQMPLRVGARVAWFGGRAARCGPAPRRPWAGCGPSPRRAPRRGPAQRRRGRRAAAGRRGAPPRRGRRGAHLAVLTVEAVELALDAVALTLAVLARGFEVDAPRRGAALAVLAVDAVAVEVDAPRRGGGALLVLAVDVVAVEVDARLDGALAFGARRRCRGRPGGRASPGRRCPRGACRRGPAHPGFTVRENRPTPAHKNGLTARGGASRLLGSRRASTVASRGRGSTAVISVSAASQRSTQRPAVIAPVGSLTSPARGRPGSQSVSRRCRGTATRPRPSAPRVRAGATRHLSPGRVADGCAGTR